MEAAAEQPKRTISEKISLFWKNLCADYKEVATETWKDCKARPKRAAVIAAGVGALTLCAYKNPTEDDFRSYLIARQNEMLMVGSPIRNPKSFKHINYLEKCYNEGTIRRLSFGLCSLIWVADFDDNCAIYRAHCKYLRPKLFDFHKRVVDIGFFDKWWLLNSNLEDYDVNPNEWNNN